MKALLMESGPSAALLMVWCVLVKCEPSCDQMEFLHPNGTCVTCPVCGPGEQLSEDCGFGDGVDGVCILCEEGTFSSDTGVAPCMRCTQCNLLNRLETTACSDARDAQCGHCLPGYYELKSITGEAELSCVPCYSHDTVHKECLLLTAEASKGELFTTKANIKKLKDTGVKEEPFSVVLIGSASASSIFFIALLLWASLLTAERFKQVTENGPDPEEHLSADDLCNTLLSTPTERTGVQSETPLQTLDPAQDHLSGLHSVSHENEVHPASIVINVTTNIKTPGQKEKNIIHEGEQRCSSHSLEEMERNLKTIWEAAQGQGIEMLDYDSVHDLSLLLDSAENRNSIKRLGKTLGVPPQIIIHLGGFEDLFQYLRTSTYTLLPQLAQAAALLPNPEVVARIHRAVVNK